MDRTRLIRHLVNWPSGVNRSTVLLKAIDRYQIVRQLEQEGRTWSADSPMCGPELVEPPYSDRFLEALAAVCLELARRDPNLSGQQLEDRAFDLMGQLTDRQICGMGWPT